MSHLTLTLAQTKTKTLTLPSCTLIGHGQRPITARVIFATLYKLLSTDGQGDVTQDDSQRRFLVQHSVAMLEQCCNHWKQCCNAVLR